MGFSEFLGNENCGGVAWSVSRCACAARTAVYRSERVGKYTLARMFAQAANCERMTDDYCGECATCLQISQLADPQKLMEQGLAERGESADAATVERIPLILQSHPDVWALVPIRCALKSPVARPMLRIGQVRAVRRAAYFHAAGGAECSSWTARTRCAPMWPTFSWKSWKNPPDPRH